jgi:hypothetical protein
MVEAFRVAHVYVSGDCWDMQSEKEALGESILPPLHAYLASMRISVVPVDCRIGRYSFYLLY